jgi:ribosomal protein L27
MTQPVQYRYGDQRPGGMFFYQRRSKKSLTEIWLTEEAFLKANGGKMPTKDGRLRADGAKLLDGQWVPGGEFYQRQREAKLLRQQSKRHVRGDLGTMFLKRPNRYGETAVSYLFWGYRKHVINPTYGPDEQLWVRADRFKEKLHWQGECRIRALELTISRRKARAAARKTAMGKDKARRMEGVFVRTIRGVRVSLDAELLAGATHGEPVPASLTNQRKRQAYLWLLAKWKKEHGAGAAPTPRPPGGYEHARKADKAFFKQGKRERIAKKSPPKGSLEHELIVARRHYLRISESSGSKITTVNQ